MAHDESIPDPINLIAEEFLDRYRRGEQPDLSEYSRRFPELAGRIREVFPVLVLMEAAGANGESDETMSGPSAPIAAKKLERVGGYRIIREIGRGGMGVVYEAEQLALGRHVALKVLPLHAARQGAGLERFRREARAAAKLHHTNIIPVFEVGEDGDVYYYAMQFIHGQPLNQVLDEVRRLRSPDRAAAASVNALGTTVAASLIAGDEPRLSFALAEASPPESSSASPGESPNIAASPPSSQSQLTGEGTGRWHYYRSVARIGVQVAEALSYAHREGVLHRDIKPSNLLLDADGRVWVTDFGLAKTDGDALTHTGDVVGTIPYMAPERFRGWSDPRSDVYSLGLTLYEMIALRPAFTASDRIEAIAQVMNQNLPRLRRFDPQVPRDLATVITKAIDREQSRRYSTAADLADDLRRFVENRPVLARQSGLVERGWRWCRRNPAVATWCCAFVLALLGGMVGATWQWIRAEASADQARTDRDKAKDLLDRAVAAEQKLKDQLWESDFEKARAIRYSGLPGQRRESLAAIAAAAHIRRSPELTDLAIASLALTDIRLGKEWAGWPEGTVAVAFDRPLQRYARSDSGGTIRILSVGDDTEEFALRADAHPAKRLRFSPDGNYLAAYYESEGRLRIWNLQERRVTLDKSLDLGAMEFTLDSRQLVVGEVGGSIDLYHVATGAFRHLAKGPASPQLAVSPHDDRLAVVGHKQSKVQIRNLSTGALIIEWPHPTEGVYELTWHPHDRHLLATAGWGIVLWDARTGKKRAALPGQAGPTTNIAFNHRGDVLASKGWGADTTLRLWDPWTGRQLVQIFGTVSNGAPLQFSPDDRWLAFAGNGRKIGLWELETSSEYRSMAGSPDAIGAMYTSIDVGLDGRLLVAASRYGPSQEEGIRFWDLHTGHELRFLPIGRTQDVCLDPRGECLFTAHDPEGVQCWPLQVEPNSGLWRMGPPRALGVAARRLSISGDGKRLAVSTGPGTASVMTVPPPTRSVAPSPRPADALAPALASWLGGPDQRVTVSHTENLTAALSPDGRWLAAGSHDGRIRIWDSRPELNLWNTLTRIPARTLPPLMAGAYVEFSPDGRWLLASAPSEYCIFEVSSWKVHQRVPRNLGGDTPGPLAFRRDGKVLAIAPSSFTVQLLDPATGRVYCNLESPERDRNIPRILRFSPVGDKLVMCMDELRMIHVWDLRLIGERLAELGVPWELPLPPRADSGDDFKPLRIETNLGSRAGESHRQRGRTHLKAREWARARDEAEQAILLFPDDAEALALRGAARYRLREYAAARDDLTRALQLDRMQVDAYHYRGHVYEELRQYREAVADFTAALERQPDDGHYHARRGFSYLELAEHAQAAADLERAERLLKDGKERADTFAALAWIYATGPEKMRDPKKALTHAESADKLEPKNYDHLTTLGVAHYRLGGYTKACDTLIAAAKLGKQTPTAVNRFFLAMCHHRLGASAAARACFDEALASMKNEITLTERQRVQLAAFRAEAESLLNTSLKDMNPVRRPLLPGPQLSDSDQPRSD
jgi:serine/threonine protein kinase/WD40 repeat protein/Flp pilus assembly protein TadD